MSDEPRKIITVLGSTKFRQEIKRWALERTINHHELILFAPFAKEEIPNLEDFRKELETQYFQKIRMADSVFVFNKDGYIGDSTWLEIEYADHIGKKVEFLEFHACTSDECDVLGPCLPCRKIQLKAVWSIESHDADITPVCYRCKKKLVEFQDDFIHFKAIETWKKGERHKYTNKSGKFGVCLCNDCSILYDLFLKEKK